MNPPQIVQLPDLCLRQIFDNLSLYALARCRSVCRLFKLYAEQTEVRELFVYDELLADKIPGYTKKRYKGYQTDKRFKSRDSISYKGFASLNPSQFRLNQRLKFLCIDVYPLVDSLEDRHLALDLNFELINCYEKLIYLEIPWGFAKTENCRKELNLPNLEVFRCLQLFCQPLVLKTPKLQELRCDAIEYFQLEHAETIRKLECNYMSATAMTVFKNLEVFDCVSIIDPLDPELLSVWPNIKELNFNVEYLDHENYPELRRTLIHILGQRAFAKCGKELKIHINDVLVRDATQLEEYDFIRWPGLKYQLKYHKMLKPDRYSVTRVNYSELIGWDPVLSSDFFELFPSIRSVGVTSQVDREQFGWFLENASRLSELYLANSSLGSGFIENLPNICPRLTDLIIKEETANSHTNFDFILQFTRLSLLQTNQLVEKPLELAEKMFQSKRFHRLWFRGGLHDGEVIEISKPLAPPYIYNVIEISKPPDRFQLALYGMEVIDWTVFEDHSLESTGMSKDSSEFEKKRHFLQDNLEWSELKFICESRLKDELIIESDQSSFSDKKEKFDWPDDLSD